MAIVVGPLHSEEARGSVGELTYNTWRGKSTVKTRSGPPGPATGARLAMLQLGKAASFAWSDLTDDQRAAWNLFGNTHQESDWTGTSKRLSGHSWYVRIYVRMSIESHTPRSDPPDTFVTRRITTFDLYPDAEIIYLNWYYAPGGGAGTDRLEVYRAGPSSAGRTLTMHDAARLFSIPLSGSPYDTYPPASGKYTYFVRIINTQGMAGPWASASILFTMP